MSTGNAFRRLWDLGYRRLTPITPPGCPVSERSGFFKRIAAGDDARGKAPGVRWPDGTFSGFDFVAHESTEADLDRWHAMGAGVGVKVGRGLVLIDADTLNEAWAKIIKEEIERIIGPLPVRIGKYPKAGYLVRTAEDFQYTRIEFGERDAKGRLRDRVEILSEGRQFVAVGIHPDTMKPYRWPQGMPAYADLPFVEPELLMGLLDALRPLLPAASAIVKEGAPTEIDQASLRGDMALIAKAVKATPNTSMAFPTRDDYRNYGYAIKAAAGPENEAEAFDLYADWCERWEDGENATDLVAADWKRMKPPFRRGASWLYELAAQHGEPGAFSAAEQWFEEIPDAPESIFKEEERSTAGPGDDIHATPFTPVEPSALPRRQWLYGHHYIRQFVSATVAPSGVGKTALTLIEFLAMASGKPLLGVQPNGCFRVWLWNGEDPRDELNLRIAAAMMHYGLTREDIGDRLFVDTGREMEIVMAVEDRGGAKIVAPVASAILRTVAENRIDVLGIDPFVSTHRVSENDNGGIDLVAKQWAKIAGITNTSVELVHHVRKLNGGEITVEDSRGAVALMAAARPKRALAGMTQNESVKLGVEGSRHRYFRIGDERNNLALPAGDATAWFELASVPLGNGQGSTPVERELSGDSVGVVTVGRLEARATSVEVDDKATAMRLVGQGEWRRDVRAGDAWVGVPIAQALQIDLEDTDGKSKVKQIIGEWVRSGALVEVSRKDAQRRTRTYVECGETDNTSEKDVSGVFE